MFRRSKRSRLALAAAVLALTPLANAAALTPPAVPGDLVVDSTHKPYLVGHAIGTQNYVCAHSTTQPGAVVWTLFGPQATLFGDRGRQLMTHFLSATPDDAVARPTWQSSTDSSAMWATRVAGSSDPTYVDPNAIPWLLLDVVQVQEGPSRGDKLTETSFLQRINTVGGKAPSTGCDGAEDLGKTVMVPYEADYVFYKPIRRL